METIASPEVCEVVEASAKVLIPMATASDGGMVVARGAVEWATGWESEHEHEAFVIDGGDEDVSIDPTDEGLVRYAIAEVEAMWKLLVECGATGREVYLLERVHKRERYGGMESVVMREVIRDMQLEGCGDETGSDDVDTWVRDTVGASMTEEHGAWARIHVRCEPGCERTASAARVMPIAGVDTGVLQDLALRLPVLRLVECEQGAPASVEVHKLRCNALSPRRICKAVTGDQGVGEGGVSCTLDHGRRGRGLLIEWMRRERGIAHVASVPISSVHFPTTATLAPCVLAQWRDDLYSATDGVPVKMVRLLGEATNATNAANVAVYVCTLAPFTTTPPPAATLAALVSQTVLPMSALAGAVEFTIALCTLSETTVARVGHPPTPLEAATIVASIAAAGDTATAAGERSTMASMLGAHTVRLSAAHQCIPLAAHEGLFPGAPEILS